MKKRGLWVAWIAALALAAMLAVTPREGAALPCRIPVNDPPTFGEPDVPGGSPQQVQSDRWSLQYDWLRSWIRTSPTRRAVAGPAKWQRLVRDRRTAR